MTRIPNTHGGGAKTNMNGLRFEQTTSLNDALQYHNFILKPISSNRKSIGYKVCRRDSHRLFRSQTCFIFLLFSTSWNQLSSV